MSRDASQYTDAEHVNNLTMLVARLVQQVRKQDVGNDVAEKAMGYLRRSDLKPAITRGVYDRMGMPDRHKKLRSLIRRCYLAFARDEWDDGETEAELSERINDTMSTEFGSNWLDAS